MQVDSVLMVEDDLDFQEPMIMILQDINPHMRVDWARSVSEAIAKLQHYRESEGRGYDLIIADIGLSGKMSGIDFWKLCRQQDAKVPFVFMSGMPTEQYIRMIDRWERGCPPFLPKPFTRKDLEEMIRTTMMRRQTSSKAQAA